MSRRRLLIALPVVAVVLLVGGPWLYLNVLRDDPPEHLSFDDATTTTASDPTTTATGGTATEVAGIWSVSEGSQAGYRVKEVLFGQDAEAVGRTTEVTGTMEIAGTTVTAAEVTVDMASVASDESRRDGQFRNRIMSTDQFPTATFTLTVPLDLPAIPADGVEASYQATGELTLRGVTQVVTVDLTARRNGATIEVVGAIPVDFDDFDIPDASGGPARVGRDGELELLLVFTR